MATANTDSTQEATTQETDYSQFQGANFELRKLFEDRQDKLSTVNPVIANIIQKTVRVVTNQVAGEREFIGARKKLIKKGTLYHIHYTQDLREYFMTGEKHSIFSKLIRPIDLKQKQFSYYNVLNKQTPLELKSSANIPTIEDYQMGSYTRYFATKSNDRSSAPFEVSEEDFDTSPLYTFVFLIWYIKGDKALVLQANNRQIAIASEIIPNVGKLVSDYQFYRFEENLTPVELVKKRLGVATVSEPAKKKRTERKVERQGRSDASTSAPGAAGSGGATY